jgi:hypothetical protein
MNIIEHGSWLPYKPEQLPPNAPPNTLFAKRESDGVDWYEYVNSGESFGKDSVKLTAIWRDYAGGYVVGPAVYDATMLFPAGHIVFEITDYAGSDPQTEFGNKVFEPAAQTFSEMVPSPQSAMPLTPTEQKILGALDAITARLEKLEARDA